MRSLGWIVFGMAVLFAACSGGGTAPATAPPTSAPVSAVPPTTSDLPTTSQATTTTTTTIDRMAEIEAILLDLVTRRTQSLVDGDEEAFRQVFANQGLLERSLPALDAGLFDEMPSEISINVLAVIVDTVDCIAVRQLTEMAGREREDAEPFIVVLERTEADGWGFSFNGEGWACDGPHPFGDI